MSEKILVEIGGTADCFIVAEGSVTIFSEKVLVDRDIERIARKVVEKKLNEAFGTVKGSWKIELSIVRKDVAREGFLLATVRFIAKLTVLGISL